MRFAVDANLSPVVAAALRDAGHDAVHVVDLGLVTADDDRILDAAAQDDRVRSMSVIKSLDRARPLGDNLH